MVGAKGAYRSGYGPAGKKSIGSLKKARSLSPKTARTARKEIKTGRTTRVAGGLKGAVVRKVARKRLAASGTGGTIKRIAPKGELRTVSKAALAGVKARKAGRAGIRKKLAKAYK